MDSSRETRMKLRFFTAIVATLVLGGCMMQNQSKPPEVGPSSFGAALTITAVPDILPRDGSSQATINMNFRDGMTNAPLSQRRILLSTTAGTLSAGEVLTDASGNAAVTLTAPSFNTPVSSVSVSAVPVSSGNCLPQNGCTGNLDNVVGQFVRVGMLGPDVPEAAFTYAPTTPTAGAAVTLDASTSQYGGSSCGPVCAYDWDFGDGSTGGGRIVQHVYQTSGVKNVTLTVTAPGGTSSSTSMPVVIAAGTGGSGGSGGSGSITAAFVVTTQNPTAGAPTAFDASSSVGANNYHWDFGDGNQSAGIGSSTPTALNTYVNPGTYNVKLTITGNGGVTASVTQPVTIN